MPDTPAPPSPVDGAARLDALRNIGGPAWRAEAERQAASGVPLRSQDQQLLETLRGSSKAGASDPESAAFAMADRLIARGVDRDRVNVIMAEHFPDWEPDTRSDAQREHDDGYGIERYSDPSRFTFAAPQSAALGLNDAQARTYVGVVKELAADIGFSDPNAGSTFAKVLTETSAQIRAMSPEQLTRTAENWERQLTAAFGDKLPEVLARVTALIERSNSPIAKNLLNGGILAHELRNPRLLSWLNAIAQRQQLWESTRP